MRCELPEGQRCPCRQIKIYLEDESYIKYRSYIKIEKKEN